MKRRLWMHMKRLQLGLTQKELAKRAGVCQTTVQAIETGRCINPTFPMAEPLAEVLQVPWTKFYEL